jgi:hypothetical protein
VTGWDVIQPVLTLGLSVSSLVVAAIALGEAARNGDAQREHNRLSVRPAVHSWLHHDEGRGVLVFYVENNGLGPAEIEGVRYFDRSNPGFECDSWNEPAVTSLIQRILCEKGFRNDEFNISITRLAEGYALRVGDQRELLELTFREMGRAFSANGVLGDLVGCRVKYSSLYGDAVNVIDP